VEICRGGGGQPPLNFSLFPQIGFLGPVFKVEKKNVNFFLGVGGLGGGWGGGGGADASPIFLGTSEWVVWLLS